MTEHYQHKARKRFGQNFLHDAGVIDRILRSIRAKPEDRLLEIGPGQGALTAGLLNSGAQLDVVELDKDLIPILNQQFAGKSNFNLHQGDALKFDFNSAQRRAEQPAGGRQPAVQHLHAADFSPAEQRRHHSRHALHAAERSGRASGRRPWRR